MTVTKLREEASEAYDLEHSGDFLQIYDEDGNWIFRAPSLEKNQFAPLAPAAVNAPLVSKRPARKPAFSFHYAKD